jgi:predicted phage-related endonuclease
MALTKEQLAARDGKITASFVPYLMTGDQDRILNEWKILVGDPEASFPETKYEWLAAYGAYVEPFYIDWHERRGGHKLTRRQQFCQHPELPHVGATIDCYREHDQWVIDVKNFHSFRDLDDALALYVPQIIVQKACIPGCLGGSILYSRGGMEPVEKVIEWPPEYEALVWERIAQFWNCVETLTPPYAFEKESAPIPPSDRRKYDFQGNNKWADLATTWVENFEAGEKAEKAKKELKKMVPPDASEVVGHGCIVTRSVDGKLFVKKVKDNGKQK